MSGPLVRVFGEDVGDNATRLERHDGDGTDGDVLGGGEEAVDEDTDKGGVQSVLGVEVGELGVGHGLRDQDESDGDSSDH